MLLKLLLEIKKTLRQEVTILITLIMKINKESVSTKVLPFYTKQIASNQLKDAIDQYGQLNENSGVLKSPLQERAKLNNRPQNKSPCNRLSY